MNNSSNANRNAGRLIKALLLGTMLLCNHTVFAEQNKHAAPDEKGIRR